MTKIPWTNKTWNIFLGCKKLSAGCKKCYALRMAIRLRKIASTAEDYKRILGKNEWNNNAIFRYQLLNQPKRWKKPYLIFVCAMNDLFFERIPFHWIQRVFAVMTKQDHHIYQVLTKRPERALQYFKYINGSFSCIPYIIKENIWFGVTVENQDEVYRIDILKKIPALVRYISIEPMLSEINIEKHLKDGKIQWVIIGSEAGPGARPLKIEWVQSLIDQCHRHNVKVFIKKIIINKTIIEFSELPKSLQLREYPEQIKYLTDGIKYRSEKKAV